MNDYQKLEMTADKKEGSFVRNLQGQTGVGFQENMHVHKDWYANTMSYEDAMENLQRGVDEREDILAPVKDIQAIVNDGGEFAFEVGLPGKSGVGGGIVALLPNKFVISVSSM